MKRIYISGPMSGMPEHNFPAFNAEAARLRGLGYEVVNPVEINGSAAIDSGRSHIECVRNDAAGLATCDTLAMLPLPAGHFSKGMDIEIKVADLLEIKVVHAYQITEPLPKILQAAYTRAAVNDAALKVGHAMIEITTTLCGPEEWPAIPELWLSCMHERDAHFARLMYLATPGPARFVEHEKGGNWRCYEDTQESPHRYTFKAKTTRWWPNVIKAIDVAMHGDNQEAIAKPDLIARGMTWENTVVHIKEALAQAGWENELKPMAINIMQRLANNAHRTGFNLALERVGMKPISNVELKHVLYTDADKDRPDVICDSNGQVTLALCKRCGKGEAELFDEKGGSSICNPEKGAACAKPKFGEQISENTIPKISRQLNGPGDNL